MNDAILNNYQRWTERAIADIDVINELKDIAGNEEKIEDAFYKDLTFGTGGLRGVIGAGTNRLNVHTVAKASQGLADYVIKNFASEKRKIAISFDSRIKSDVFAKVAAGVFAANGIKVAIYSELMPTPCLSFAVRYLGCAAGVMVTASHNPAKYNGYKVYGADGCQITTEAAAEILAEIEKLYIFDDVKRMSFEEGFEAGKISYISEEVYTAFVEEVKKESVLGDTQVNKDVAIVYSPLNGTGLKPVIRTLKESGYTNITVVKEQEQPDGNFPTCPYPNPEVKEAMELGIEYAKKNNADLLLATDPDCDRVGIAVKNTQGEYVLLSGNETGMLLLDYICSRRTQMKTMPQDPVTVKTIVTIDMAERIAAKYGVKTINFLTEHGIEQYAELESKVAEISAANDEATAALKDVEHRLGNMAVLIKNLTTYKQLRPVVLEYRKAKDKAAFRREHESQLILYEAATKAIKDAGITRLPDLAALKAEYRELDKQKARLYEQYGEVKRELKEYGIIKQNVDSILRVTPGKEQAQEL